jgi:hypothetical protein
VARAFNGTNQYLSNGAGAWVTASPWTLAGWVNPSSFGSTPGILAQGTSVAGAFLSVTLSTGGALRVSVDGTNVDTGGSLAQSAWNHWLVTYDGTTVRGYVNGASVLSATRTANYSHGVAFGAAAVSSGGAAGEFLQGSLAELGIWNVALTAAEIAALALGVQPRHVRPGSLAAYWPLWGLSGNSVEPDLSGSANNLTLVNSPAASNHAPVTPFTRKTRSLPDLGVIGPAIRPEEFLQRRAYVHLYPDLTPALF